MGDAFSVPFIHSCYGSWGAGGKLGGLPKHFCLMKGDLEKKINLFLNLLFHQIILIKEINILEYLVLI